jgi:hypothetical protein
MLSIHRSRFVDSTLQSSGGSTWGLASIVNLFDALLGVSDFGTFDPILLLQLRQQFLVLAVCGVVVIGLFVAIDQMKFEFLEQLF